MEGSVGMGVGMDETPLMAGSEPPGGEASGTAAPQSLRRSKRDAVAKADSGKVVSGVQEESAAATRRSQRSGVKSAFATPTREPPPPVAREMAGKKTARVEVPEVAENESQPRRTRPTRAATVAAVLADPSTPVASPLLSPTQAPLDGDDDALAATAAVLTTPTRNRRPSRRQLEVETPVQTSQLLLGEFSANDATALCEEVWYQIKENSYKPDVLLRDRSPASIDWHRVAERLAKSHEITLTPRACQRLWKFLAYAQDSAAIDGELLSDSEPEDYELTADKINARVTTAGRTPVIEAKDTPSIDETKTVEEIPTAAAPSELLAASTIQVSEAIEPTSAATATPAAVPSVVDIPRETRRTDGIQLFPVYDQPLGIPDDWRKPFDLKHSMPLVFVAEKFLKRKVVPAKDPMAANGSHSKTSMEVDPSILAAAAMNVTLTGEKKSQPKYKKKRLSDAGGAGGKGEEQKPKKPRKKKEPTAVVGKFPVTTLTTIAAAVTKSPVLLRQGYVPSLTAPPTPTPARTAVNFFSQLYKENPTILHTNRGEEKHESGATPAPPSPASASTTLDAAQLNTIFASAPPHVRTACEQMANDDLRRFEREHLRRRLWEKARSSLQSSPAPSPATAAPPSPFPVVSTPPWNVRPATTAATLPTQANSAPAADPPTSATLTPSSSHGTTSQISTSVPSA